jgi:uracil-DNA glycosylase
MKSIEEQADTLSRELFVTSQMPENPIDLELNVIPPFKGASEIKLIIIGQDPTIRNVSSRKKITRTLNLDKSNSLKTYIGSICEKLGITLENVYATNLFKYFYTYPPADTPEVLQTHLEPNLKLLEQELEECRGIPVITLGQPVLQLLCGENALVRNYWDYDKMTGKSNGNFSYSNATENKLNRDFYPFPHQPSIRKEFYKNTLDSYSNFMKSKI